MQAIMNFDMFLSPRIKMLVDYQWLKILRNGETSEQNEGVQSVGSDNNINKQQTGYQFMFP